MFNYFFHPLPHGEYVDVVTSDIIPMLIIWAILIPLTLWLVRLAYKSIRKPKVKYQNVEVYLCRDLFLGICGMEYLLVVLILAAVYFGVWAYFTAPFSASWLDLTTWLIVIPQIALLLTIITVFFYRYTKFRNPYLK
jgi:hypothetical protein